MLTTTTNMTTVKVSKRKPQLQKTKPDLIQSIKGICNCWFENIIL